MVGTVGVGLGLLSRGLGPHRGGGGRRLKPKEGAGARPTSTTSALRTTWPGVLGTVDGSGSDVEVEVDEADLAVVEGAEMHAPVQPMVGLLEDGEEENMEVDPLLVERGHLEAEDGEEEDAEDDDVSHTQVPGSSSLASAIQPVGFAMVLDTLSRALERLPTSRRRLVSGLLLGRLRGRLHAVTGQMLEALLVTFEPFEEAKLEDSVEADVSWAAYWWDVVAVHLPDAPDAPQTIADSVPSDMSCPVGTESAQLVAASTTDAVEAECGGLHGSLDAVRPEAVAACDCGLVIVGWSARAALVEIVCLSRCLAICLCTGCTDGPEWCLVLEALFGFIPR